MQMFRSAVLPLAEMLALEPGIDFLYLSDLETYELHLLVLVDELEGGELFREYQGKKCYKLLQGRDEPCPFCTNHLLRRDRYHIWKFHNPRTGGDYVLRDKLVDWNGREVRMEVVSDVSDAARAERVLANALEGQNLLVGCAQTMLHGDNLRTAVLQTLRSLCAYFDAAAGSVILFGEEEIRCGKDGRVWPDLLVREPTPALIAAWSDCLRPGTCIAVRDPNELANTCPEGKALLQAHGVHSISVTPVHADGQLVGLIGMIDIEDRWSELPLLQTVSGYFAVQKRREELRRENRFLEQGDILTGQLNYVGFCREAERLLRENPGVTYALLYSDIKEFKFLNDALGFDTGDELLRYWSDEIAADLTSNECFGRVSADKFVSLCRYESIEVMKRRFASGVARLNAFPPLVEKRYQVEMATGLYRIDPGDPLSMGERFDRANIAQKEVKKRPGSKIGIYSENMRQRVLADRRMEHELRDAIRLGEFELALQPQMRLGGCDDVPVRAEALVRWYRDGVLYAMPGDFIGLFERSGQIVSLDLHVFELVCRLMSEWRAAGAPALTLAVNVSRVTMLQPGFVERYCRIRDSFGLEPGCIELEFTEETAVRNIDRFAEVVSELQQRGFLCALDDFGTGQSSLGVLRRLPIDVLKLDRAFFVDQNDAARGEVIVSSVIELAQRLGMCTVAEGIEQHGQIDKLQAWDCNYVQGYVCSRPLLAKKFYELLMSGERWTWQDTPSA